MERDTSRDPKFLFCFSMKCAVIFFGVYILFDLLIECALAYFISQNEYLDEPYEIFYYVYIILLLPLFISATLFMLYFCERDGSYERNKLSLAVFLAFISSLLIFIWIVVYVCFIYQFEDVYIGFGERAEEGQEETNYSKISKTDYIVIFGSWSLVSATFYLISWLDTKDFVSR
eukprot:CAMPEP_0168611500 /NCGR_PEP_ID=MMETSP0449_2-20121227/2394_1 /TAXON_ID=1082188 /ORGANISM="Strombidium rassoulzadegani, Strain ras09" /LENGTH=173 /DNA_ID=CAMNT_0008651957 /DNA_START=68 /DNA_END=586 /DNA_ORIENTATION=+